MAQRAYPLTIESAGQWSPVGASALAALADESDSTYIVTDQTSNVTRIALAPIADPGTDVGFSLKGRVRTPSGSGGMVLRLVQGESTEIARRWHPVLSPTLWTDFSLDIEPAEAALITDFADLHIEITSGMPGYVNAISFLDKPGKHPAFSHAHWTVDAACQQFDGSLYQPQIGEIGSHGMRRVQNLAPNTGWSGATSKAAGESGGAPTGYTAPDVSGAHTAHGDGSVTFTCSSQRRFFQTVDGVPVTVGEVYFVVAEVVEIGQSTNTNQLLIGQGATHTTVHSPASMSAPGVCWAKITITAGSSLTFRVGMGVSGNTTGFVRITRPRLYKARPGQTVPDPEYVSNGVVTEDMYGPEKVTNGTFANDTDWTKGANTAISGGVLTISGASTSTTQAAGITGSGDWLVTFNIATETNAGSGIRVRLGGIVSGSFQTGVGAKSYILTSNASANGDVVIDVSGTGWQGSIDNVSVRRINYHGWGIGGVRCLKTDEYGIRNDRGMRIHGLAPALSAWSYGPTLVSMEALPDGFVRASNVDSYDGQLGVNATILLSGHSPSRVGARVLLRAGPGSDRISLAFYNGAFADCTYRVLSGPGRFSGLTETTGTGRIISGLSLTEPTEVEFYMNGLSNPAAALNAYFYIDARSGGGNPATSVANEVKIGVVELLSPDADSVAPFDALSTVDYGFGVNGLRWVDGQWRSKYPVRAAGAVRNPAITNLLGYSEGFSDAAWSKAGSPTVTSNTHVAPDGTLTADTLTDPGGNFSTISQAVSIAADSLIRTASVFIRRDTDTTRYPEIGLDLSGGTGVVHRTYLNTATGALTNRPSFAFGSAVVDDSIPGWWRVNITVTNNGTNTTATVLILPGSGTTPGVPSSAATGSVVAWGAMLNVGSIAFPYTWSPTTSAALAASEDSLDAVAAGWDQSNGGVIVLRMRQLYDLTAGRVGRICSVGTNADNRVFLYLLNGNLTLSSNLGGVSQGTVGVATPFTIGEDSTVVMRVEANALRVWVDGVLLLSDTSFSVPPASQIVFGSDGAINSGAGELGIAQREAFIFPPGTLTDAQLLALSAGDLPAIPELA